MTFNLKSHCDTEALRALLLYVQFPWHVCCALHSWGGCRRWLPRCRPRCKGREMERGRSLICERTVRAEGDQQPHSAHPRCHNSCNSICRCSCDGLTRETVEGRDDHLVTFLLLATIFVPISQRTWNLFFFLNTYVILYSNSVIFTQCYFLMFC